MKQLIIIAMLSVVGYFYFVGQGSKNVASFFEAKVTIKGIKSQPSMFADSLIELADLRVIETRSILNYSHSRVSDKNGDEITLLSTHPFRPNEAIKTVKGRYTVLYAKNDKRCEVFIAEDLNALCKIEK